MSKIETIEAQTKTQDNVTLKIEFNREFPESLDEAVEMFSKDSDSNGELDLEKGKKVVFNLFESAFKIALQAPARKQLVEHWKSLPESVRETNTELVEAGGLETYTGTLPQENQEKLLQFLTTWIPGQRQPRVKVVRSSDPAKDLFDMWDTLPEAERMRIMQLMSQKFSSASSEESE